MPYLGFALGYRLWVPDQEFDEARTTLQEKVARAGDPLEDNDKIHCCPDCGSDQVVRYRSILWLPLLWLLDILYPAPGGNLRTCMHCGRNYKAKGPALTGPMQFLILLILFYIIMALVHGHFWLLDIFPIAAWF